MTMKIILSNRDKSVGLVSLEGDSEPKIVGKFSAELIESALEAIDSFRTFCRDDDRPSETECLTVGIAVNERGEQILALKPSEATGTGWVVVCPRVDVP